MKYIVISDVHFHKFNDFSKSTGRVNNTRFENQLDAVEDVLKIAQEEGRVLLFAGDLFHQRGRVDTQVFNEAFSLFKKYEDVKIVAIEGNHDNVDNSINSVSSLEPFKVLKNFTLIEAYDKISIGEDTLVGVSYGEEYSELKEFIKSNKATILMAHLGVEGSYGAGMSKLDGPFSTGDLLVPENYDVGLLGHYHRRQEVSHNVFYIGNPVAQNFSDSEQQKGYVTFETDKGKVLNDTMKFTRLKYPMFIKVDSTNIDKYGKDIEVISESNFVRVVLNEDSFKNLSLSDGLDDLPENLRVEKQVSVVTDSRIDITDMNSTLSIADKWSEEYQPDNKKTILEQLKKVL